MNDDVRRLARELIAALDEATCTDPDCPCEEPPGVHARINALRVALHSKDAVAEAERRVIDAAKAWQRLEKNTSRLVACERSASIRTLLARAEGSNIRGEGGYVINDVPSELEVLREENKKLRQRLIALEEENISLLKEIIELRHPEANLTFFGIVEKDETQIAKADRALRLEKVDEE